MKRLALLLAGTAMPLALFAAPDLTSRAAAQTPPPSVEMMLEEAGLDAQALERLESTLAETQEEARALRERADELSDRAATSTAQAADARAAFEALADDSDADPDAIAAARADAEDAAAQGPSCRRAIRLTGPKKPPRTKRKYQRDPANASRRPREVS